MKRETPPKLVIGRPCKTCGDTERYANSHSCVSCSKQRYRALSPEATAARKSYNKQYRDSHGHSYSKQEMKEYNRVYNAKKKGVDPKTYRIRGEIPLDERILENSMPVTECGCWIWLGRLDKDGYGHISVNGRSVVAPRVSYEAFRREKVPDDAVMRHTCDFPPCVNPDHLTYGTNYDNIQDRVVRGRTASKLSRDNIPGIRSRHADGETYSTIARDLGVSTTAIYAVIIGKTWRHVP
jgi:hypothetical protein